MKSIQIPNYKKKEDVFQYSGGTEATYTVTETAWYIISIVLRTGIYEAGTIGISIDEAEVANILQNGIMYDNNFIFLLINNNSTIKVHKDLKPEDFIKIEKVPLL